MNDCNRCIEEPYWEVDEAAWRLSGCFDFDGKYNLPQAIIPGKSSFNFSPQVLGPFNSSSLENFQQRKKYTALYEKIFDILIRYIQSKSIRVLSHELQYIQRWIGDGKRPLLQHHAYFIKTGEILSIALLEGISIPEQLQQVIGLYPCSFTPLSKGSSVLLQRQAVAQVIWRRYPSGKVNISTVCRDMSQLRKISQFSFLRQYNPGRSNAQFKREREDVRALLEGSSDAHPPLPGILHRGNGHELVDFPRLSIVLVSIAKTLCFLGDVSSWDRLLDHPLIAFYWAERSSWMRSFVEFVLKDFKVDFEESQILPEN